MHLVIADTGPINYLVLIGYIDILPALFEKIVLPSTVRDELMNVETPAIVHDWIVNAPLWVEMRETGIRLPNDALTWFGVR